MQFAILNSIYVAELKELFRIKMGLFVTSVSREQWFNERAWIFIILVSSIS